MRYWMYTIGCCLFLVDIFLLYSLSRKHEHSVRQEQALNSKINKLFHQNLLLKEDIISSKIGMCTLSPQMYLYTESGDSITLSGLKMKKIVLF